MQPIGRPINVQDTGIDPKGDLQHLRHDQRIRELPGYISCVLNTFFCLSFPITCCCAIRKVKPMTDTIVTRWGVVTDIWRKNGPHCFNPICTEIEEIDMRLKTLEIKMDSNDKGGNPIVVYAKFNYRVIDSYYASFKVSGLSTFLQDQAKTALKLVTEQYHFQSDNPKDVCLKGSGGSNAIDQHLMEVLQTMVKYVGIGIENFNLMNVHYETTMEKLLLVKQEAQAEVIARKTIADGTAGIIQELIKNLKALGIDLREEERNKLATDLTLLLAHRGHTTLNLIQERSSSSKEEMFSARK